MNNNYEYRIVDTTKGCSFRTWRAVEEDLNKFGKEGWCIKVANEHIIIMERATSAITLGNAFVTSFIEGLRDCGMLDMAADHVAAEME